CSIPKHTLSARRGSVTGRVFWAGSSPQQYQEGLAGASILACGPSSFRGPLEILCQLPFPFARMSRAVTRMVGGFMDLGPALLNSPRLAFPGGTPLLQLVLRWIHFIAGITWVGLLYFFNLVNTPFLKQIDASTRARVVPVLMPRALWWFRWASLVTVFAGIWYWMIIVSPAAHNPRTSGGRPPR